ncbi:hypothetical protein LC612_23980 [Nostoc sp. CHAB 5834]|nr:hypothetical protein [Nostoc sp. CHAB 5834]
MFKGSGNLASQVCELPLKLRYQENKTVTNRQLLIQRCRTQQPTHSARSSQLLETLRVACFPAGVRHNWLVMY